MKKTINFLTVIIILLVAASVGGSLYESGRLLGQGFAAGFAGTEEDALTSNTPVTLSFEPEIEEITNPGNSVELTDGSKMPVIIQRASVMIPDNKIVIGYSITVVAAGLVNAVLFVLLLVAFFRFILNINRNRIFEWCNVKCLRQIGWYLIIIGLVVVISRLIYGILLSDLSLSIEGYSVKLIDSLPLSDLIIGIVTLLMAEIWSRGISMREEQELTI